MTHSSIPYQENTYNDSMEADLNSSLFLNISPTGFQAELDETKKNRGIENEVILWALLDGFLFLAIIFGNILTIYVLVQSKNMSTVISNRFILSLAISDLFVGFMVLYHMMFYIQPEMGDFFGFCFVRLVLMSLMCTASVFNILGIAIDRYVAIVYPLHYHKIITKKSANLISFVGWTISFGIASTIIVCNKWNENINSNTRCEMSNLLHPFFLMIMYVPAYVVLYIGMCVFYIRIIKETRKHTKRMNHLTNDRQSPWKSIQVLTLVLGSFTISYTPYIAVVILNSIFQKRSKTMSMIYKITYSLVFANSAVNPIIYAWKNQELKKSIWNVIHCKSINCSDEII